VIFEIALLLLFFLGSIGLPRRQFWVWSVGFLIAETVFVRAQLGIKLTNFDETALVIAVILSYAAFSSLLLGAFRRRKNGVGHPH